MDKVPRKKQKKALKKPFLLLGLAAFALLCLGGIWITQATRPMPEMPETAEEIYLLPRSSKEIAEVTLAAAQQESYTLLQDENGKISLKDRADIPLRSMQVSAIFSSLHQLEAVEEAAHLHSGETDLTPYGLSPAQAVIDIQYRDGEATQLLIGSAAPTDVIQYYAMLDGSDHIFTIYSDISDPFFYEKDYLRDFDQPDLDTSLLDKIQITGQYSLSLSYSPSGWQMEVPFSYPLNPTKTDALLKRIEQMGFESCLGAPDEVDLKALGLDQPALSIILTQAATVVSGLDEDGSPLSVSLPQQEYCLTLGNETGKSGVYLQWEGMIYKASNFLLGFWKELTVDEFLLQNPINFLINDLNSVSIKAEGLSAGYTIQMVESITENNQVAVDEYGRILFDAEITKTGQSQPMADPQAFLSWYAALSGMLPSGKMPANYTPSSPPLVQIQLQSLSVTREIALYSYDPFYHALSVDGQCLYFVENTWLDKIKNVP